MNNTNWNPVRDGDPRIRGIYERHYSARKNGPTVRGEKNWNRICGPGEHIILLTTSCDALFVWIKQKYRHDGQIGVNCAVFRNENKLKYKSSVLIREAEELAWQRWPGDRLFTYVDSTKIKSTNPGWCFILAGWSRLLNKSARGLVILEKLPNITA